MKKIILLVSVICILSVDLLSQQWPDWSSCYQELNCVTYYDSQTLTYMGCTILIEYKRKACPDGMYFEIDDISYNAGGGNCAALHLFLHPQGDGVLDVDRYKQVVKDIYEMLFNQRFEAAKLSYQCPNYARYIYYWPGSCSMVCETIFNDNSHNFHIVSCKEDACCGKMYDYCYDPSDGSTHKIINTLWVGTACPPQSHPDTDKCPKVGDVIFGLTVTGVNVSYCTPDCYQE